MDGHDPTDLDGLDQADGRNAAQTALRADLEAADFKWVMSNRRGRRHLWRLLERAGLYRTSFTTNANLTAFNEGRRDVGLYVLDQITRHTPDGYTLMLKEAKEDERNAD